MDKHWSSRLAPKWFSKNLHPGCYASREPRTSTITEPSCRPNEARSQHAQLSEAVDFGRAIWVQRSANCDARIGTSLQPRASKSCFNSLSHIRLLPHQAAMISSDIVYVRTSRYSKSGVLAQLGEQKGSAKRRRSSSRPSGPANLTHKFSLKQLG